MNVQTEDPPPLVVEGFAGPGGWSTGLAMLGIPIELLRDRCTPDRVAARFIAKVVAQSDGCLVWAGRRTERGYGRVRIAGREFGAHRVALVVGTGLPLDQDEMACHHCDNPPCVTPEHLFHGTAVQNTRDMDAKGRRRNAPSLGEANGFAKLSLEDVRWIRSSGQRPDDMALALGVSESLVRQVRRRDAWRWVA